MLKNTIKSTLIMIIAVTVTACASNNASKFKGGTVLKNTPNNTGTLPSKELHVIFEINKDKIELQKILPSNIQRAELITLLNDNEGKDFAKGDAFTDCIILTNSNTSRSCFEVSNKNIPSNSIFHNSETSGTMIAMTVLVPYLAVGAAGDGDFYVENKIDNDLVNRIGQTLKSKMFDYQNKIHQSLKTLNFDNLPTSIKPYGQLIEHKALISAIKKVKTLEQYNRLQTFFDRINYHGFIVKSSAVNQRTKPTTRSKINNKHKKGELIFAEKIENDWIYNGEGWIYKKILLSLSEDAKKQLLFKKNNLQTNQNQRLFLANKNTSSTDVSNFLNDKNALKGVSKEKVSELVALKNSFIEKETFIQAEKLNTIDSYSHYLKNYPNGKYYITANGKRENVWFKHAQQKNTPTEFRKFLRTYPESEHYQAVREQWFQFSKDIDEIASYKEFLRGYEFTKLEQKARVKWLEIAKGEHSISTYRDFLSGYANNTLEKEAAALLEPLWFEQISLSGNYDQLQSFLKEVSHSKHKAVLSYAFQNCPRIASLFFTTKDACVSNYLNIDEIRNKNNFSAYAQAYALTGDTSDFNTAQKLAKQNSEKAIIEYFALSALKDKSRLFSIDLKDKHVFLGNREHGTWFAQGKGSSSAKIKGKLILSTKKDAPFKIQYGNYTVTTNLNLKAYYAKEVRSSWIGNSNTNPIAKDSKTLSFYISKDKHSAQQDYNFGTYQVAYKDTGMMGGYTAKYLEREVEFSAQVTTITPRNRLNIFKG